MARIKVEAMKDIGPIQTYVRLQGDGKTLSDARCYKKGEIFEIDEKLFSDYEKVESVRGITFRGSMRKVGAEPLVVVEQTQPQGEAI